MVYLDRAIGRFREGEQSGVVDTKLTVRNMIEQLDNQLKQKPEDSPYYGPVKEFPADYQRRRQRAADQEYRAAITDRDLSGADPPARLPQDRISAARRATAYGLHVHEGRRQAVPPT